MLQMILLNVHFKKKKKKNRRSKQSTEQYVMNCHITVSSGRYACRLRWSVEESVLFAILGHNQYIVLLLLKLLIRLYCKYMF